MRRLIVLLVLLAAPFAVVPAAQAGGGGCHGPVTANGAETTVPIRSGCFTPTVTEVGVGDTVTWVNDDPYEHDVAAVGGAWSSDTLQQGDEFSQTFDAAGVYVYVCRFHPGMAGAVDVVDADEAQPIAAVTTPTGAENGDGPGLAGAAIVIFVLLASIGGVGGLLLRRPRLG